jgi:hypothetical protein
VPIPRPSSTTFARNRFPAQTQTAFLGRTALTSVLPFCVCLDQKFRSRRSHRHATAERLVDLLLLVDAELARTAVDQQQETANDGEDLEEVVLGEVLVRVVLVELSRNALAF